MATVKEQLAKLPELDDGDFDVDVPEPWVFQIFQTLTRIEVKTNSNEKELTRHMREEESKIEQLDKKIDHLGDKLDNMNTTQNLMLQTLNRIDDKAEKALSGFPKKGDNPDPEGHKNYHVSLMAKKKWWEDFKDELLKKWLTWLIGAMVLGTGAVLWSHFLEVVNK